MIQKKKISISIEGLGNFEGYWTMESNITIPDVLPEEPVVVPPVIEEPIVVPPQKEPVVVPPQEEPVVDEPTPTPPVYVGMEKVDISGSFIGKEEVKLDAGKHYWGGMIERQMLFNRNCFIEAESPENRPILELGIENYNPFKHGKQEDSLFWMHNNSIFLSNNVDICQSNQLKTVETWNPNIVTSASVDWANWTAIIRNCDTTRLGKNGGFGIGDIAGSSKENHIVLINFKHWGTGLISAKNPYKDGVMYVTMRNVEAYLGEEARISPTNFEYVGSLKDNIIKFDGSAYDITSGYNFKSNDNFSYIMLWDRYTFFIDGRDEDTVISENTIRLREQAKGESTFGVLDSNTIYSNQVEMHAGDSFLYDGQVYRVIKKDRLPSGQFYKNMNPNNPDQWRAIGYTLDRPLPVNSGEIEVDYKSKQIEFTNQKFTFSYLDNNGFQTDLNTKYRDDRFLTSRGIGHLTYCDATVSMDLANSKLIGRHRGSRAGGGKSLIWNLDEVVGMEGDPWLQHDLPITHTPDLPLHPRVREVLQSRGLPTT